MIRNTILMDMDGTLLPMDMNEFAQALYDKLEKCDEILSIDANRNKAYRLYCDGMWMMLSGGQRGRSNEETFFETVCTCGDRKKDLIERALNHFYENDFNGLVHFTHPSETPAKIIEILKRKGYRLIVATNPVFPLVTQLCRLRWAGLDPKDFMLVTSYTDTYACKPDLKFYIDILEKFKLNAKQCYMIGNNVEEDLCASELGVEVFFLNDYPIGTLHKGQNFRRGGMDDFLGWAKELPEVE